MEPNDELSKVNAWAQENLLSKVIETKWEAKTRIGTIVTKGVWFALRTVTFGMNGRIIVKKHSEHITKSGALEAAQQQRQQATATKDVPQPNQQPELLGSPTQPPKGENEESLGVVHGNDPSGATAQELLQKGEGGNEPERSSSPSQLPKEENEESSGLVDECDSHSTIAQESQKLGEGGDQPERPSGPPDSPSQQRSNGQASVPVASPPASIAPSNTLIHDIPALGSTKTVKSKTRTPEDAERDSGNYRKILGIPLDFDTIYQVSRAVTALIVAVTTVVGALNSLPASTMSNTILSSISSMAPYLVSAAVATLVGLVVIFILVKRGE